MKQSIESIKGFRAIAFIIIFLSHANVIYHDFGALSVSFFLVLSGFVNFYAHEGENIELNLKNCISFAYRRIKRMYPLHLIMIIPAIAIQFALIFVGRDKFNIIQMLTSLIPNIFLFHTWIPINRIYFGYNGVAWYLSTYVFLCFMFPLLFKLMKRWSNYKAIISLGISMTIPILLSLFLEISSFQQFKEWLLYVFPPVRLLDYFAGMQVGWLYCKNKRKWEKE